MEMVLVRTVGRIIKKLRSMITKQLNTLPPMVMSNRSQNRALSTATSKGLTTALICSLETSLAMLYKMILPCPIHQASFKKVGCVIELC